MRRISGCYDGVEQVIVEYDFGIVECPTALVQVLQRADQSLPTGEALLVQCRALFGATLHVREL